MRDGNVRLNIAAAGPATERPISIAIVAMGGQGGGVLTDWIVLLGEKQGWVAQSTSVPGVAQRTGATIYYVEMMKPLDGRKPILSQMPTAGDVDVVIASEYMEAGRSILRGLVTPDRTTLIASDHRAFAVTEKTVPGNGVADSGAVTEATEVAAKRTIAFDMDALAVQNGSVISSAMFGALAAAGILPFGKEAFIEVIRTGGKGVDASVRTFEAAFLRVTAAAEGKEEPAQPARERQAAEVAPAVAAHLTALPEAARHLAAAGWAKVVDFQDVAYGREYVGSLERVARLDDELGGEAQGYALTATAAKYVANAMAYDDVIRVADLKTRSARRARIEADLGLKDGQVLQTTEFMHPRAEEVVGMLPNGLARWIMARPRLYDWIDRRVNKGRRVETYSLSAFLLLYFVGGLRGMRRRSHRHAIEVAHRDEWLDAALEAARSNYLLGVEILKCRRLVKGYSDTHSRGLSKFDRTMAGIRMVWDRKDAEQWARRLREAALRDPAGEALDGMIKTIAQFADE